MTRRTGQVAILTVCWLLGACINVGPTADGPLYCGLGGLSCCNGTGCYEGAACAGGTCRTTSACPTRCGGFCTDTSGDPNHCGGCGVACAAGLGCTGGACESLFAAKWVIDSITLPTHRDEFSIDLDGDNRPDNSFAYVVNVLGSQMLRAQDDVSAGIASGVALHLISLGSHDPGHRNDPSPTSTVALALPHNPPDLKGTGTFTVDDGQPAARFAGTLLDRHVRSVDPVTTKAPVSLVLDLPLFAHGPDVPRPLLLPLQGAHIDHQVMDDGNLRGSICRPCHIG